MSVPYYKEGFLHRLALTEDGQGILYGAFWACADQCLAGMLVLLYGRDFGRDAAKNHGEWAELERMVLESTPWRKQPGDKEKFAYLCGRRLKEGGLGWLFGLTVCAAFCFCLLAGYMGFTLGWIITVYTVEWGIMGLPSFFLSCFPQMLLYLPAWGLLLWQGLEGRAKIRPLLAVTAALLLCGGAGLEAFINPWFI